MICKKLILSSDKLISIDKAREMQKYFITLKNDSMIFLTHSHKTPVYFFVD